MTVPIDVFVCKYVLATNTEQLFQPGYYLVNSFISDEGFNLGI